ncbi:uncharacterized protein LOC130630079 [Hydractinia symbiolongicarpus]|uniref:uncharacterized protein LOC130630079 n=1 Tax=Hydractinia symbiolongicarpus TaxID=13093 RepID=UPI0025507EBF|nr:uncharacterized protein LOC130630079 [Hydractinia symbiolongicarpus]
MLCLAKPFIQFTNQDMVLPKYFRQRIINLKQKRMTYTQISKIIEEEDGKKISRQTISKIVQRFNETKSLAPKRKSGRKRKLTLDHHNFIDKCYENNDELTSVDVQKLVKSEFQLDVSSSCIRQARQKIGWTLTGPRYCQLVRVPNQVLRLEFCQKLLRTNEQFEDVIFTDESTIMMDNHGKICFRKKGRLPNLKPTAKHPYKIHVWAGISKRGPTDILLFTGIMRKEFYADEILQKGLLPFIQRVYPDRHRFQQNNDPKHKSKIFLIIHSDENFVINQIYMYFTNNFARMPLTSSEDE